MEDPSRFAQALKSATAFSGLTASQLQQLYRFCSLKVVEKGEIALLAGSPVDELQIVLSGRLTTEEGAEPIQDFGRGQALEETAFFTHGTARQTVVARRESVLLCLDWDDLLAAGRVDPSILASCLAVKWNKNAGSSSAKPSRLVLCPAGASAATLAPEIASTLLQTFEAMGEMRLLTRTSFGAGLPGAITMEEPQTVHWLQEQEAAFDLTVIVADPADADFSNAAIEEADEIILIASGRDPNLGAFEKQAFNAAGRERCRLLLPKGQGYSAKEIASWIGERQCRAVHRIDMASAAAVGEFCSIVLGRGIAVAASSRGVYAAAIAGALQAFETAGLHIGCLGAAGSAILPAGLIASGWDKAKIGAIFKALSSAHLWRRTGRPEAGLFEAAPIDRFLVESLPDLHIEACDIPFVAVSRSLSAARPELHRTGRLRGAIRANLTPPGILPPLVIENGTILMSGEAETSALLDAVWTLTPSPIIYLHAKAPTLGASPMSYRDLAQTGLFRIAPFQTALAIDWRLRLETVLAMLGEVALPAIDEKYCFEIPIPESVTPLDWGEWAALQAAAYDWTLGELERKGWITAN